MFTFSLHVKYKYATKYTGIPLYYPSISRELPLPLYQLRCIPTCRPQIVFGLILFLFFLCSTAMTLDSQLIYQPVKFPFDRPIVLLFSTQHSISLLFRKIDLPLSHRSSFSAADDLQIPPAIKHHVRTSFSANDDIVSRVLQARWEDLNAGIPSAFDTPRCHRTLEECSYWFVVGAISCYGHRML